MVNNRLSTLPQRHYTAECIGASSNLGLQSEVCETCFRFSGFQSGVSWTRWDLNPGPPPCKGGDLPADLRALSRGLVWPTNLDSYDSPDLSPGYDVTVFRFPINKYY